MLVHSLASTGKHARFVVLGPPRDQNIGLAPLLKSDDFFREPREIGPPPLSKILDMPLHYNMRKKLRTPTIKNQVCIVFLPELMYIQAKRCHINKIHRAFYLSLSDIGEPFTKTNYLSFTWEMIIMTVCTTT